jgi:hypothetical protein
MNAGKSVAAVVDSVADRDTEVFVFSTHGAYAGDPAALGAPAAIEKARLRPRR